MVESSMVVSSRFEICQRLLALDRVLESVSKSILRDWEE